MTKGAQAFRDLARLRRGSSPRGGRPDHRQGAPGRRPPSLPARREMPGRGRPQGVRRGPAGPGRRQRRIARAATGAKGSGAMGSTLRVTVVRWPPEWNAGPTRGGWLVPPQCGLCRQFSWSKGVTQTGCILPPQPRHAASPNFLLDSSLSLFSFDVPKEDTAPRAVCPSHPPGLGRPPGGGTRCGP